MFEEIETGYGNRMPGLLKQWNFFRKDQIKTQEDLIIFHATIIKNSLKKIKIFPIIIEV